MLKTSHTLSASQAGWLEHRGSLTQRLRQLTQGTVIHQLVYAGWGQMESDEAKALGLDLKQPAWIREIEWRSPFADHHCWISARVVIPQSTLQATGTTLLQLGERSLGDILFADPKLERSEIELSRLTPSDPYFMTLIHRPFSSLDFWARRSVFYWRGAPLLVVEIFWPEFFQDLPDFSAISETA